MIQLKVFYNISFSEDRAVVIALEETELKTFEDLLKAVRSKVDCLQFIPDTELRIKYRDDEQTFVNLRSEDTLHEALRCASIVQGATFRRLTVKIEWQPQSTPEIIERRRESGVMSANTRANSAGSSKRELFTPTQRPTAPGTSGVKEIHNDSPVERMLQRKRESITSVKTELNNAKAAKDAFERQLARAQGLNSGRLTICGQCHLKTGHNRRICDGEPCTSVMLCGLIEKHPEDKATRRSLSQAVEKTKSKLTLLETEYQQKYRSYRTVEDSFARKIEDDIISTDPDLYVVNGVKNWALLNQHVALLQKKCKGNLPPRNCVGQLLKDAVREFQMHKRPETNPDTAVNPKKRILQDEYAIRFPKRSSTSTMTSTMTAAASANPVCSQPQSNELDFKLAVSLQNELIK